MAFYYLGSRKTRTKSTSAAALLSDGVVNVLGEKAELARGFYSLNTKSLVALKFIML